MRSLALLASALFGAGLSSAVQNPLSAPEPLRTLATGQASLTDLASDEFVVLSHPEHPEHTVRIKETTGYCDPGVRAWAGYLDVDRHGKNIFFQFFESRAGLEASDVLTWINGGPGSSSALGLYMELGPCKIVDPASVNGTEVNRYSWNTDHNLVVIDSPVGVGLSYAESGQEVARTEQAAADMNAFVRILYDVFFKDARHKPLLLSGESYGGRYLPVFAAAILDANKDVKHPINLTSVIIGNGVVDRFDLTTKHYDLACTNVTGLPPVLGVAQCAGMQEVVPRCEKMMEDYCETVFDALGCQNAIDFCYQHIKYPYYATGGSPFDMSKPNTAYDAIESDIAQHLNTPAVRARLGVDAHAPPFEGSSARVAELFANAMDHTSRTSFYVAALLHHGVKVLIYAGEYDYQCGWPHQLSWTRNLAWTGQQQFNALPLEPWFLEGDDAEAKGVTKSFEGLTLVSFEKAGHMVPYDKPVEALEMLTRWKAKGHL